ncbi:Fc.00g038520.m01.CDS01 [Cosmosporella sp. VM-42]
MASELDIERRVTNSSGVDKASASHVSISHVGRQKLSDTLPPHESYEGRHRWDTEFTWTIDEEKKLFFGLQLDRGNLSNALADDLLKDLKLTSDDYNNGTTIQLICFLAAEFQVQMITKRYGFKNILPTMMVLWGIVSWAQTWIADRTGFYITRALIGFFEGGFIPGVVLFTTYFYISKDFRFDLLHSGLPSMLLALYRPYSLSPFRR